MMIVVIFAEWLEASRAAVRRASRTLDRLLFPPRRDRDADPPSGWFKHPPI
jgi:hypothetical protein